MKNQIEKNEMPESGNPRISGAGASWSTLSAFAGQTSAATSEAKLMLCGYRATIMSHSNAAATAVTSGKGGAELGAKMLAPHFRGKGGVRECALKGIRGGSWNNDATNLRVSDRNNAGWTNTNRNNNVGFRPASNPEADPGTRRQSWRFAATAKTSYGAATRFLPLTFSEKRGVRNDKSHSSFVAAEQSSAMGKAGALRLQGNGDELFKRITSFKNILNAFFKARRAKKEKPDVADFSFNLERKIPEIKEVLENALYSPGEYTRFTMYEPKKREIAAPGFTDRVVHHALCNVIAPIFERQFIYHSYACRSRKGMHRAMIKAQDFLRWNDFYLKCDVKSFFFSIDHNVLREIIARTICPARSPVVTTNNRGKAEAELRSAATGGGEKTMRLVEKIIESTPNPGLPIGNLTSQLFANVDLNELDHFVKRELKTGQYLRYMDDFVLFSNSKKQLWEWKNRLEGFLNGGLKLELNPLKVFVAPYKEGLDFCGYRVFRDKRRLRAQNVKSFRKRLSKIKKNVAAGLLSRKKAYEKIQSWYAHSVWANTHNLRERIFKIPHPQRPAPADEAVRNDSGKRIFGGLCL